MNKYTVIGFHNESHKSLMVKVIASCLQNSFYQAALIHPNATLISSIKGHLEEGVNIEFSGESLVDSETILEQEDVFNSDVEIKPVTSTVLADFDIQDWRLSAGDPLLVIDASMKETYRFVIEQSPTSSHIFFTVYSKSYDDVCLSEPYNGLSGVIEIRNGRPAISIGLNADDLALHVESDIARGLYLHTDGNVRSYPKLFKSDSHGRDFPAQYYECEVDGWLTCARNEVANHTFENYDMGDLMVTDTSGWSYTDGEWEKTVYFEHTNGSSLTGTFKIVFAEKSAIVCSAEM